MTRAQLRRELAALLGEFAEAIAAVSAEHSEPRPDAQRVRRNVVLELERVRREAAQRRREGE